MSRRSCWSSSSARTQSTITSGDGATAGGQGQRGHTLSGQGNMPGSERHGDLASGQVCLCGGGGARARAVVRQSVPDVDTPEPRCRPLAIATAIVIAVRSASSRLPATGHRRGQVAGGSWRPATILPTDHRRVLPRTGRTAPLPSAARPLKPARPAAPLPAARQQCPAPSPVSAPRPLPRRRRRCNRHQQARCIAVSQNERNTTTLRRLPRPTSSSFRPSTTPTAPMSAPSAPDPTSGRGSCVRPSSDADGGLQLDRSLPYERRPSSAARPQDDAWKTPDASRRPSLVKTPDAGMPHPEVPPYCDSGSRPSTSTQDPCATAAPSLAFQNATAASEPPACVSAAARLWRWLGKHLSPEEPSEADLQDVGIAMRALRQHQPGLQADTYAEENSRAGNMLQQRPVILPTRSAEIAFVAISCVGQGLFSHYLGNAMVLQKLLLERFNMPNSQAPWLSGAYSLSNGVMVVVAGALADMYGARIMILSALLWLTFSSVLGAIIANNNGIVYLIIRAFLGLGVAGMTSASIRYVRRRTLVFGSALQRTSRILTH